MIALLLLVNVIGELECWEKKQSIGQLEAFLQIPGDIGQLSWNPGGSGPTEHIGIYIGTVNGTKYWIHCTGHSPEAPGVKHPAGKGIVVNDGNGSFHYYGRCPSL